MPRRGGVSALLATFRLVLGNPVVRIALKRAVAETTCRVDGEEVRAPLLEHVLTSYAGLHVACGPSAGALVASLKTLIRLGVALLGGNDREARTALSDPAVRRGVRTVLEGIALYGVTVPQKLPAPFMVVWNFTNACNLKCKHCYQRASKPLPNELTLEEKLRLVDELDRMGVAGLALSGGEPTIHPDYLVVIKAAARRGMYTAIATNGWRYADIDELRKAKEAGLRYVEVSVDSANPKVHDAFRGVEGSWARAVKALENAVKLGLSTAMAVTLTKLNVDEVEDLIDLAESIGVQRIVFFNFIPVGRGTEISHLDLDPLTREQVLRRLYQEMKRRRIEVLSTAPQYGRVVMQMSGGREAAPTHYVARGDPVVTSLAEFVGGCGAGRIYAAIQPEGTVTPCVFMPIPLGSVRREGFSRVWNTHPLLLKLRDRGLLKGFCSKCPYVNVCGGCRARAYAYFEDPLAPDPGCLYNLRAWRLLVEERQNALRPPQH